MYPKLRKGAILRGRLVCEYPSEADRVAVTIRGEVYFLTAEAFRMLSSCNGTIPIKDIPGLVNFIDENPTCLEIISLEDFPCEVARNQVIETNGLVAPCRQAIWHLTKKCNMKCLHCYYLLGDGTEKQTFSDDEISSIASNLSALGVESVRLSGGEASLNSSQLEFTVNELTSRYCIPTVLNTNGWKRQDFVIKTLQNNPLVRGVQISLDGTETAHNELRGVESYKEIVSNIAKYLEAGIHVRVISMLTEAWIDKGSIQKVCGLIATLGVRDWKIEIPSMTGRWLNNLTAKVDEIMDSALVLHSFLENVSHSVEQFTLTQVFSWPISPAKEPKTLQDPICSHDLGLITFGPEGVSYCTLFQRQFGEKMAHLGHLYTDRFKDIWNTIVHTRLTHTIFENSNCKVCNLFPICQGGCPGQYVNPAQFQGCDIHSRNLALARQRLFALFNISIL